MIPCIKLYLFCSKGFRGTSDFDVVVTSRADLTITSVPFVRRQPTTQSKSPLREMSTMPSVRKVNLVEAKVVSVTPTTRTIPIRGTERELQECLISDGTDKITLQLWEHHINAVQMLSSYRFTDLSTRVFKGKVQLTTTLSTAVEKIPNLRVSDTAISTPEPAVNSVTGSVYALELRAVMKCSICGNKQDKLDHRTVFHRCQSCNMKQKTATFIKLLSGMLRIQTDSEKHTLAVPW
ncbi:hypothetical protein AMEX_G7723 [Astyanax mexicanus]|uniref:Replication protein A OB domain-containing protein n=1 Tax=Astyanax mexicanus TaxID=7994 RepID=A0A8T2M079_ASTMX|nr:hypothetical protein AMEX_G7723 [Astyanax mexicanus]